MLQIKRRKSAVDDHRNDLVLEFLRIVSECRPRYVLIENDPGIVGDGPFDEFESGLDALGFGVTRDVLVCGKFGAPQNRKRLVLLAARGSKPQLDPGNAEKTNVRDAIEALAEIAGNSSDPLHDHGEYRTAAIKYVIESIPKDGGSRADLGMQSQLRCRQRAAAREDGWDRDQYARRASDKPASTITGGCVNPTKGRFLHPVENRSITFRDKMLLRGFPPSYRHSLRRGKHAAAELVRNAIPPVCVKAQELAIRSIIGLRQATT